MLTSEKLDHLELTAAVCHFNKALHAGINLTHLELN